MLRVWSQAARPQAHCNCVSCSSSVSGIVARRTASATTRRQIKLVDAFTILLAPVLATAFVADSTWKDRRRQEWDRKIAEVEGEVERLRCQEGQILSSLKWGTNIQKRDWAQRRSYSTAARALVTEDDTSDEVEAWEWQPNEREPPAEADGLDTDLSTTYNLSKPTLESEQNQIAAAHHIEKLVAVKLAIRMLIHVQIGTSPRFLDTNPEYTFTSDFLPKNLDGLVTRLKQIRRSLHELNSVATRPDVSASHKLPRKEQFKIDNAIRRDADSFKKGNMSASDLIIRTGHNILSYPQPPSIKAYVPLITVLSRARLDELAYLVMAAMDEGRLTLPKSTLFTIIWQYGKHRDAQRFEIFLKSLTKTSAASKYTEEWHWKKVKGVEVPCPVSNDSRLLQILIYASLQCNQPHRAEAWAKVLKDTDHHVKDISHVLRNFMKYYTTHQDWQNGRLWLATALKESVSIATNVIRDVQRVVFAMLELCVACGKQKAYACILRAAVEARLGVFEADADLKFTERSQSILAEWRNMHKSISTCEEDAWSAPIKTEAFRKKVYSTVQGLKAMELKTSFDWPTPQSTNFDVEGHGDNQPTAKHDSAKKWRQLCSQQEIELNRLRAELAEAKLLAPRAVTEGESTVDAKNRTAQSLAATNQASSNVSTLGIEIQPFSGGDIISTNGAESPRDQNCPISDGTDKSISPAGLLQQPENWLEGPKSSSLRLLTQKSALAGQGPIDEKPRCPRVRSRSRNKTVTEKGILSKFQRSLSKSGVNEAQCRTDSRLLPDTNAISATKEEDAQRPEDNSLVVRRCTSYRTQDSFPALAMPSTSFAVGFSRPLTAAATER